ASLFVGIAHETEGGEPLVALIVIGADALDGLLLRLVDTKTHAQAYVLTQDDLAAVFGAQFLVLVHNPIGQLLAIQRQHAFDIMLGHKLDAAPTGHRLPDFHWTMYGTRDQGNLTQFIAAVRHTWGQRIVLALV